MTGNTTHLRRVRGTLCTRAMIATCLLTSASVGVMLGLGSHSLQPRIQEQDLSRPSVVEIPAQVNKTDHLRVNFDPVDMPQPGAGTASCPQEVATHTDASFEGGAYVAQAGFAEKNVAAISVEVSPEKFPLRIDLTEMVFATSGAAVTTTTQWSLLVWEGTPTNGTLVAEFSSDGLTLPHIVMPPGTNGVNVQVSVDPSDPEQIIVYNNGSNTFSIGYRIDKHNNPSQTSPNCLPAPQQSNAFPVTDTSGLAAPKNNWVGAPPCILGCVGSNGYMSFHDLAALCTPSGDWVMRVTYTPLNCPSVAGACCLPNGSCQILENFECADLGGMFQGDGVFCHQISCPQPMGACCTGEPGGCMDSNEADCAAISGTWVAGMSCASNICTTGNGACCIPDGGGCIDFPIEYCALAEGVFHGIGSTCASTVCFPIGACCLPDGTCADEMTPEDCAVLDGVFQGHDSLCDTVTCPAPEGACCLPNGNCLVVTENTCGVINGTWYGMNTDCNDSDNNGTADICEEDDACVGDLNGDGNVDITDMLGVLANWGACGEGACNGDLNDDGVVDITDMLAVLSHWGACP